MNHIKARIIATLFALTFLLSACGGKVTTLGSIGQGKGDQMTASMKISWDAGEVLYTEYAQSYWTVQSITLEEINIRSDETVCPLPESGKPYAFDRKTRTIFVFDFVEVAVSPDNYVSVVRCP